MERLLLLRLQSVGCAVEARLNDIPVGRTPAGGGSLALPVHEYLFEGANEITLVIDPVPSGASAPPRLLRTPLAASLRLLLPRVGHVGSELSARCLAEVDWTALEGDVHAPPRRTGRQVMLPIKFPRWRWLDAPVIDDPVAVQPLVASFIQGLAIALAKGDPEPMLQAARLRFEELALAYQQPVADLAARWRSRIQLLHATQALQPVLPALNDVLLKPCAGGRLLECVGPTGEPALRTEPAADGTRQAWPVRVTVIDGRCLILR
jgi:hypothetical protein